MEAVMTKLLELQIKQMEDAKIQKDEDRAAAKIVADASAKTTETVNKLLEELNNSRRTEAGNTDEHQSSGLTAEKIRSGQINKIYLIVQKSTEIKQFKHTTQDNVREWLATFDNVCGNVAKGACSLNLDDSPLSNGEYITLLRSKISYTITQELGQKITAAV